MFGRLCPAGSSEQTTTYGDESMNDRNSTQGDLDTFGLELLRWGSKLFITGLVLGLIPIAHYIVGGVGHEVGEAFLSEVTLWFGCPAEKMVQIVQIGGLSLLLMGAVYSQMSKSTARTVSNRERLGLKLCIAGLIAEVLSGGVLYLVLDWFVFPNFYFTPTEPGRTIWLTAQFLSFSVYLVGIVLVMGGIKRDVVSLLRPSLDH
jgi:hypothetical protein